MPHVGKRKLPYIDDENKLKKKTHVESLYGTSLPPSKRYVFFPIKSYECESVLLDSSNEERDCHVTTKNWKLDEPIRTVIKCDDKNNSLTAIGQLYDKSEKVIVLELIEIDPRVSTDHVILFSGKGSKWNDKFILVRSYHIYTVHNILECQDQINGLRHEAILYFSKSDVAIMIDQQTSLIECYDKVVRHAKSTNVTSNDDILNKIKSACDIEDLCSDNDDFLREVNNDDDADDDDDGFNLDSDNELLVADVKKRLCDDYEEHITNEDAESSKNYEEDTDEDLDG